MRLSFWHSFLYLYFFNIFIIVFSFLSFIPIRIFLPATFIYQLSSLLPTMKTIREALKDKNKIVITAALPYANGTMHVGHVLEHIQVDIYTRFLRLLGKDCLLICASDMHGTPIEINAHKAGMNPHDFARKHWKEHQEDFRKYLVDYNNYYHTDGPENKELALWFYNTFNEKGYIYRKKMLAVYCEDCQRYLPDRFVKGQCPYCEAEDQYGDICEKCSTILKGVDLVNPKCTLCDATPHEKETEHYFFKLKEFSLDLKAWINNPDCLVQKDIRNWVNSWLEKGLEDWCISRDSPYYGFEVPNSEEETGEKKYLYVWLDAPIGYLSSTMNYLNSVNKGSNGSNSESSDGSENGVKVKEHQGTKWQDYWQSPDDAQGFHFIGKDIIYFHYLFWPMMLKNMDIPIPILTTHGFVNINGEKMSKSRGNYYSAREFFELYGAEAVRFYYASHLDRKVVDIDLNLSEFQAVNNRVLIANLGNFCYRSLSFAAKNYPGGLVEVADGVEEKELKEKFEELVNKVGGVKNSYYEQEFKVAVKKILEISDLGNVYFQHLEPWRKRDSADEEKEVASKVAFMVNLARNLSILVKPILPLFSEKVEKALGVENLVKELNWDNINFNWTGVVDVVEKLVDRIEIKENESEKSKGNNVPDPTANKNESDGFPIDIRVGKVVSAGDHPNAEKLFLLKVDFGKDYGVKQILTGLKDHFVHEDLENKKFLFCPNLKPAKLRGELSEGMILVAEEKVNDKDSDSEEVVIKEKLTLLAVKDDVEIGVAAEFPGESGKKGEISFDKFKKYKMNVETGKIVWKGKLLQLGEKIFSVKGASDGAKIC